MNHLRIGSLVAALLFVGAGPRVATAAPVDPLEHVDPFIGTGGHGHTFPGPTLPFGLVQLSPDTRLDGWDGCSGYHFSDTRVFGFSHTHLSGTGVSDYGDILLLPATGPVRWISGYARADSATGYGSRFRKSTEQASAGYYGVRLDDYAVGAELTATLRTGLSRFTFETGGDAHILVDLQHRDPVIEAGLRVVSETEIEGFRRSRGWAVNQRIHFVARFSRPVDALLALDDAPQPGLKEAAGRNVKAALRFRTRPGEAVLVKVGVSGTDLDGARRNLDAELPGWSFEAVRSAAREAWRAALGRVEVEGGTHDEQTIFYTALYHTLLQPNTWSDVDGRYRGRDDAVHLADGYTHYTVFSLWDTFRAAHPLYTILEPRRTRDFILTFLAQYREGGRLPVWELSANETDCMIGYHAASVITDAHLKGIGGFDARLALEAMRAGAEGAARGLPAYRRHGYIPADVESESVSKTLEYAYDDWCIARMAESLGDSAITCAYDLRARSWESLLDPESGFMRPRRNGGWLAPFRPTEVDFNFTEANSWQYSFFIPHHVPELMTALGGARNFTARLDSLFSTGSRLTGRSQDDITGLIGQYAHGNEPSHHVAYLYALAGMPRKTQQIVQRIRRTMYTAAPDGLIGNEDCGQMSAWYVLSALGFYSVCPGRPEYVAGVPLFPKVRLRLENGRTTEIVTRGGGGGETFVTSIRAAGRPVMRWILPHAAIVGGGRVEFELQAWPGSDETVMVPPARIRFGTPWVAAGAARFRDVTRVELASRAEEIRYTLDGTDPGSDAAIYREPIELRETTRLRFCGYHRFDGAGPVQEAVFRRITGDRAVVRLSPAHRQYTAGGNEALIDGQRGGDDFRLGAWIGFYGIDMEAIVDLGRSTPLHRLAVGFLQDQNSWIFMPLGVEFSVSDDGTSWTPVGAASNDVDAHAEGVVLRDFGTPVAGRSARFVRAVARAPGMCPDWHKGAGNRSFIFADEFVIE